MSKIYTKTGDKGKTSLFDGTRVAKNSLRVETYGTVDELNSLLGVCLAELSSKKFAVKIKKELQQIQSDLFEIGAILANPKVVKNTKYFDDRVEDFEILIDNLTEKLPALNNFILPSGGKSGALLHLARTVARRCERRVVELSQKEKVDGVIIRYFNRLSDLLFTMSRFVNLKQKKKELIWEKRKS